MLSVWEKTGNTPGKEKKKNIYIYSAGGSHYGCVSYAKEADGKRKNNEFIYTHSVNNNEKGKKKNSCKAQPMENTELKKKTNTDVKLSADNKYGTLPTK